jgi:phage tail sheath protein FI
VAAAVFDMGVSFSGVATPDLSHPVIRMSCFISAGGREVKGHAGRSRITCDRTTMTQADILNGRLVCEIGIAVLRPAEFVVFRVFQQTAEAQR